MNLSSNAFQASHHHQQHFVSINGRRVITDNGNNDQSSPATISIYDTSLLRGDGVFEVMKVIFYHHDAINDNNNDVEDEENKSNATPRQQQQEPIIRYLANHLERLQTSAHAVQCPLPRIDDLVEWLLEAAQSVTWEKYGKPFKDGSSVEGGDGGDGGGAALRLMITKGSPSMNVPPSTIISIFPIPDWPDTFTLLPLEAPWHPAGLWEDWSTPIKWTSYGPNVVSTQKAKAKGYTDALLMSPHRIPRGLASLTTTSSDDDQYWKPHDIPITQYHVLDGPNFAIGFIEWGVHYDTGGTLHLPDNKSLGLLPSITQQIVATLAETKLNMTVLRGIYKLETLIDIADEVFVTSTTRGIKAVTEIGELKTFPKNEIGKYTKQLMKLLDAYGRKSNSDSINEKVPAGDEVSESPETKRQKTDCV